MFNRYILTLFILFYGFVGLRGQSSIMVVNDTCFLVITIGDRIAACVGNQLNAQILSDEPTLNNDWDSLQWSVFPNGGGLTFDDENAELTNLNLNEAGTYNITLEGIKNVSDTTICQTYSDTITIKVHENPTSTISINPPIVCPGDSIRLNFDTSSIKQPFTINYIGGEVNGVDSIGMTEPIPIADTSIFAISSIIDGNGCMTTYEENENSDTVYLHTRPMINNIITNDSLNVSNDIEFEAEITSSDSISEYRWTFVEVANSDTSHSSDATPIIRLNDDGAFVVSLTVIDINGCESDEFERTFIVAEFHCLANFIVSNDSLCQNELLVVENTTETGDSSHQYTLIEWKLKKQDSEAEIILYHNDGIPVIDSTSYHFPVENYGSGTYTLTFSFELETNEGEILCNTTTTQTITILPRPQISLDTVTTFCLNQQTPIFITSNNVATQYTWNFTWEEDSTKTFTTSDPMTIIYWTESGHYDLAVNATFIMDNITCTASAQEQFIITESSSAPELYELLLLERNNKHTLFYPDSEVSYRWYKAPKSELRDSTILLNIPNNRAYYVFDDSTTHKFNPGKETYWVEIWDDNDETCSSMVYWDRLINDSIIILPSLIRSEEEPLTETIFKIYPNPNNGEFVLSIQGGSKNSEWQTNIYDQGGRLIQREQIQQAEDNQFDYLLELPASTVRGLYYLQIIDGQGQTFIHKFIKN